MLIFAETGIQFMPINTLYHLAADAAQARRCSAAADAFLNIGDYFNYLLCGVAGVEESNASTTQLYDPRTAAVVGGADRTVRAFRRRFSRGSSRPARCSGRCAPRRGGIAGSPRGSGRDVLARHRGGRRRRPGRRRGRLGLT